MSAPPPPAVGDAAGSSDAEMEGRQGVPRRGAAAGNAGPQEQQQQEGEVGEGGWVGAPHEGGGGDEEEAVFGGGLGLPAYGNDDDEEEDAGARVPGRAVAEGMPAGRNTCCICLRPWTADGAHRVCCIPCGHVYGKSCLFRWLMQSTHTVAKLNVCPSFQCPQCGEQYKYDGIIDIYATTEHLWDDSHHKQASRQGAIEEEASREVMDSALEAIAWRDEVIARRDEVIAEVIAKMEIMGTEWISKMEIRNSEWKTLIDEIMATLKKYRYALRACFFLLCVVLLCWGVSNSGST